MKGLLVQAGFHRNSAFLKIPGLRQPSEMGWHCQGPCCTSRHCTLEGKKKNLLYSFKTSILLIRRVITGFEQLREKYFKIMMFRTNATTTVTQDQDTGTRPEISTATMIQVPSPVTRMGPAFQV